MPDVGLPCDDCEGGHLVLPNEQACDTCGGSGFAPLTGGSPSEPDSATAGKGDPAAVDGGAA